jgi:hypothetical protein
MSNMTLIVLVLVVVIVGLFIAAVIFTVIKRNQYMREAKGHVKVVLFPEAGMPKTIIAEVGYTGHEVAAPDGSIIPRYYFDRQNIYRTPYPDNPFLGMASLQVQIDTAYYYKDNPEPITSQAINSPQVATASMIFASIDSAFALVVHELDAELQKTKKQLLDALSSKLSKPIVYIALAIITVGVIIACAMVITQGTYIHQIGAQLLEVK